jgi:predicted nucleic acid-binding protein
MKKLLFDSSSIIYAVKKNRVEVLADNYIQRLTIYECLNALWKEAYLVKTLSSEELEKLLGILLDVFKLMRVLSLNGYEEEILRLAIETGLTVYDTSYIVLASKNNLSLVTEDRRLRSIAEDYVEAHSLDELL